MRQASIGRLLLHIPSILLLGVTALFYSYVIRARLALGHWPTYGNPDPKDLGFDLHRGLVWLSGTMVLSLPALWLILAILALAILRIPRNDLNRPAFLFAGLFVSWFLVVALDPFGFGDWFAD